MSILMIVLILVVLVMFGARSKAFVSKLFDLAEGGSDVGQVHLDAMKSDAEQSAELNSLEKQDEIEKRLKRLNQGKTGDDVKTLTTRAPARVPKK